MASGCLSSLIAVDEDHPMFGEIYDAIQEALMIWGYGDNVAAAGCLDQAILIATDTGDSELVGRLGRFRQDIESDANLEDDKALAKEP